MPLLPLDFDRAFFNAAPRGLVSKGHLRGDEAVRVSGASPEGRVEFALPGVPPPRCRIALRDGEDESFATNLDTVIIDLDARRLVLLWRNFVSLRGGPFDVSAIEVSADSDHLARASEPDPANVVALRAAHAA